MTTTSKVDDTSPGEASTATKSRDDRTSTPPSSSSPSIEKHDGTVSVESPAGEDEDEENPDAYPSGIRLICIVASLCLTVFLFTLDGTILATALPEITDRFNSLDDIAWYSAAFFLTTCAFQLPFGRAYQLLNVKMTYQASVLTFLLGSAVCGATPSSIGLIIGRAIAGIGGAGVIGGVFIIIAKNIPLRKRGLYAGFVGASVSISSVLGPVIGGAFTTHASWRWCFYINLPVGAVVFIFVQTCLPEIGRTSEDFKKLSWWQKFLKFNPLSTVILLGWIVCLILALQWGGESGDWSEPRIVATLVVFAVTLVIWLVTQYLQGEDATVPWSIAKQRTVAGSILYSFVGGAAFTIVIYWLPIWFQTIKEDSAEQSGIHSLPLTIALIVFSLGAGALMMVIGYYSILLIAGTVLMSVGAGLLMTLEKDSSAGYWIGYQIVFAAGLGVSLQQCNIAIQTVLPDDQIPIGASLVVFSKSLAGSVGSAIGQNVYQDGLSNKLAGIVPASVLSDSGVTTLLSSIKTAIGDDPELYAKAVRWVNESIMEVFMVALILACMTLPACFLIEWKSVRKEKRENEDAREKSKRKKEKSSADEELAEKV